MPSWRNRGLYTFIILACKLTFNLERNTFPLVEGKSNSERKNIKRELGLRNQTHKNQIENPEKMFQNLTLIKNQSL